MLSKRWRNFSRNGLKIEKEANLTVVDYLDVILNLKTNSHKPYMKPNHVPLYVHSQSNHPLSVLANIFLGVSMTDSASCPPGKLIFNTTVPPSQQLSLMPATTSN